MLTFAIDLVVALLVVATVYLIVQICRLRKVLKDILNKETRKRQNILDEETKRKLNIEKAIMVLYKEIVKRWPGATLAAQVIINWQTTPEDKLANLVDLKNNLEKETQK